MRVYLDACCVCRPFDDSSIERNRIEAEAVLSILTLVQQGELEWVASPVLIAELNNIVEDERREQAVTMLKLTAETGAMPERATTETLVAGGFKPLDAMHVAAAIRSRCQVFLTTDDRLLRKARRMPTPLPIHICSPLAFLGEQFDVEHDDTE